MPNNGHKEIIDSVALYGTLGGMGGVAMYLNQVRKGRPFRVGIFFINVFLAGWLGVIAKDFIPSNIGDLQYSLVSLIGFLAFPILDYIEDKGFLIILKRFLGPNK